MINNNRIRDIKINTSRKSEIIRLIDRVKKILKIVSIDTIITIYDFIDLPSDILANLLCKYVSLQKYEDHMHAYKLYFKCNADVYRKYESLISDKYIGKILSESSYNYIPYEWLDIYLDAKNNKNKDKMKEIAENLHCINNAMIYFDRTVDDRNHIPSFIYPATFDFERCKFLADNKYYFKDCYILPSNHNNVFVAKAMFSDSYSFDQVKIIYSINTVIYNFPNDLLKKFTSDIPVNKMKNMMIKFIVNHDSNHIELNAPYRRIIDKILDLVSRL